MLIIWPRWVGPALRYIKFYQCQKGPSFHLSYRAPQRHEGHRRSLDL